MATLQPRKSAITPFRSLGFGCHVAAGGSWEEMVELPEWIPTNFATLSMPRAGPA